MKPVTFLGDSLKVLRGFPDDARRDAGFQIDRLQRGLQPDDFKPMPDVGKGVEELRIWSDTGTYRVIYIARGSAMIGTPDEVITADKLSALYGIPIEVLRNRAGRLFVVGQPDAPPAHAERAGG